MVAKENRTNNNNNSSLYRAKFYILSDYRQDKGVARGTIRHKIIKRGGLKQLMDNLNKANLVMKTLAKRGFPGEAGSQDGILPPARDAPSLQGRGEGLLGARNSMALCRSQ